MALHREAAGGSLYLDEIAALPSETQYAMLEALEQGIEARTFWKPMHLQRPYEHSPRAALPVSSDVWPRIVTLPSSTSVTDADLDLVCTQVADFFARR